MTMDDTALPSILNRTLRATKVAAYVKYLVVMRVGLSTVLTMFRQIRTTAITAVVAMKMIFEAIFSSFNVDRNQMIRTKATSAVTTLRTIFKIGLILRTTNDENPASAIDSAMTIDTAMTLFFVASQIPKPTKAKAKKETKISAQTLGIKGLMHCLQSCGVAISC